MYVRIADARSNELLFKITYDSAVVCEGKYIVLCACENDFVVGDGNAAGDHTEMTGSENVFTEQNDVCFVHRAS